MSVSLHHTVAEHGYALIPQHMPELGTFEAVSLLGLIITLEGFSMVQKLQPHTVSAAPPNTYSGNFGMGEFPMHTDLAHWVVPPRYLALRCITGASEVGTGIFDGNKMINDLGATSLRRTLVQPRRPLGNDKQLLRLLDFHEYNGVPLLRWDSLFLRPATAESERSYALVAKYIELAVANEVILLTPGDTLIVDNWRMIHRRSPVPVSASDRHIDRVYLGELH